MLLKTITNSKFNVKTYVKGCGGISRGGGDHAREKKTPFVKGSLGKLRTNET